MRVIKGWNPLDCKQGGDTNWSTNCWSESTMMRPGMVFNSIMASIVAASVIIIEIVLLYAVSSLRLVPAGILVLIFSWIVTIYYVLWLMLGNREHIETILLDLIFLILIDIVDSMIEIASWSKESMRRSVAYIVVPICCFGYGCVRLAGWERCGWLILSCAGSSHSHDNITMWLAEMMVVIHAIYNRQPTFCFYGTNNVVGGRPLHRVALKSKMDAAAATLTNKGVEILAAAIDSSLSTGGVATSANQSLRLLLDSGASSHVVGDKSILQGYRELANPRTGTQPDGSTVSMIGVGTIQTEHFTITDVYHVKGLSVNLISVSQLYRQYGMGFWFLHGRCGIMLADATAAGGGYLDDDKLYVLTSLHVPSGPVQA